MILTFRQNAKLADKQTNAIFVNQWHSCEQNNHIINLYTMITIICVWFKTYITNTDKWHELVQVNWEQSPWSKKKRKGRHTRVTVQCIGK